MEDNLICVFIKKQYNEKNSDNFVKQILKNHFNVSIEDNQIKRTIYGKSYIPNLHLNYNVTHSKKWIVLAVSIDLIGIDMEHIEKKENMFSTNIIHNIKKWTIYESYIKAIGKGMSIEPKDITIRKKILRNNGIVKGKQLPKLYFNTYKNIIEDYYITICTSNRIKNIKIIYE